MIAPEKSIKYFENPEFEQIIEISQGFSWKVFFLGPLYYMYKGMVWKGIGYGILGRFLAPTYIGLILLLLWLGYMFPDYYAEYLQSQGWEEV